MRLKNFTKRMAVITFPHEEVCGEKCFCTRAQHLQTAHNPNTGDVGVRDVALLVPRSVYIPAGAESEDLPESFGDARQVRVAMTNGLRKVA